MQRAGALGLIKPWLMRAHPQCAAGSPRDLRDWIAAQVGVAFGRCDLRMPQRLRDQARACTPRAVAQTVVALRTARTSGFAQQNCFPAQLRRSGRGQTSSAASLMGAEPRADANASSTASEVDLIRSAWHRKTLPSAAATAECPAPRRESGSPLQHRTLARHPPSSFGLRRYFAS